MIHIFYAQYLLRLHCSSFRRKFTVHPFLQDLTTSFLVTILTYPLSTLQHAPRPPMALKPHICLRLLCPRHNHYLPLSPLRHAPRPPMALAPHIYIPTASMPPSQSLLTSFHTAACSPSTHGPNTSHIPTASMPPSIQQDAGTWLRRSGMSRFSQ